MTAALLRTTVEPRPAISAEAKVPKGKGGENPESPATIHTRPPRLEPHGAPRPTCHENLPAGQRRFGPMAAGNARAKR
jgi:hypothetical protein